VEVTVNNVTQNGTWTDRTCTLNLTLDVNTDYHIRVSGQDLAGNVMTEFSWTFRTEGVNATVYGRVLVNSTPLAGAKVVLGEQTVYTNATGHFSLILPPGDHVLNLTMDGYRDKMVIAHVDPGEDVDLGDILLEPVDEDQYEGVLIYAGVAIAAIVLGLSLWFLRRRK